MDRSVNPGLGAFRGLAWNQFCTPKHREKIPLGLGVNCFRQIKASLTKGIQCFSLYVRRFQLRKSKWQDNSFITSSFHLLFKVSMIFSQETPILQKCSIARTVKTPYGYVPYNPFLLIYTGGRIQLNVEGPRPEKQKRKWNQS